MHATWLCNPSLGLFADSLNEAAPCNALPMLEQEAHGNQSTPITIATCLAIPPVRQRTQKLPRVKSQKRGSRGVSWGSPRESGRPPQKVKNGSPESNNKWILTHGVSRRPVFDSFWGSALLGCCLTFCLTVREPPPSPYKMRKLRPKLRPRRLWTARIQKYSKSVEKRKLRQHGPSFLPGKTQTTWSELSAQNGDGGGSWVGDLCQGNCVAIHVMEQLVGDWWKATAGAEASGRSAS